jgi:hypothetical protein
LAWKTIVVINEEEVSTGNDLCSFCKPRIYDLSKLGWKKKHNVDGGMYLEPDVTVLPDGDVDLVPFKDMEAFGPYGNDFPKRYGPIGVDPTVKGIEASGKHILIEFFKGFDLPGETSSEDSSSGDTSSKDTSPEVASLEVAPPDDWEPTITDCPFCKTIMHALLDARELRQHNKPWNRRVYIWCLNFQFETRIVSDLMLNSGPLGAKLMLKSLVFKYQPRTNIAECELPVCVCLKSYLFGSSLYSSLLPESARLTQLDQAFQSHLNNNILT